MLPKASRGKFILSVRRNWSKTCVGSDVRNFEVILKFDNSTLYFGIKHSTDGFDFWDKRADYCKLMKQ